MRRHSRRLAARILLAAAVLSCAVPAAVARPPLLVPDNPSLPWRIRPSDHPCPYAICKVMTRLVLQQTARRPSLCALLETPAAAAAGIRLPVWHADDYRKHLGDIEHMVILSKLQNDWEIQFMRRTLPGAGLEQLQQAFWKRYAPAVLDVFARGEARYETANFDVDSDQVPDRIFRITLVEPVTARLGDTPRDYDHWRASDCDGRPVYHIYLSADEAVRLPANYFRQLADMLTIDGNSVTPFTFAGQSFRYDCRLGDRAAVSDSYRRPTSNDLLFSLTPWQAGLLR